MKVIINTTGTEADITQAEHDMWKQSGIVDFTVISGDAKPDEPDAVLSAKAAAKAAEAAAKAAKEAEKLLD